MDRGQPAILTNENGVGRKGLKQHVSRFVDGKRCAPGSFRRSNRSQAVRGIPLKCTVAAFFVIDLANNFSMAVDGARDAPAATTERGRLLVTPHREIFCVLASDIASVVYRKSLRVLI